MYSMRKPIAYNLKLTVNGCKIIKVLIGRHYLIKHGHYINDALILQIVTTLDGGTFPVDSTTDGIEYYAADIEHGSPSKVYRLIWIIEGGRMEILGIINAYRRKKRSKS